MGDSLCGLPLPVQEWLDRMLHQDIHQRFSAAEGLEALTDIADVFVDGGSISTVEVDTSEASLEFLELLEDAIDDETEGKRAERVRQHQEKLEREHAEAQAREEAYRVQIERERKENIWTESEAKLWSEMSASLEQLNRAIEADRVSVDKGMRFRGLRRSR